MRERINAAVVSEIGELLAAGANGSALIDGSAVQSGDIAILVRNAREGQAIAQRLGEQGIRSVTIGRDSVFASDEARGLYDLLLAISQCGDSLIAKRSLASNLLQLDYRDIAAIVDDDRRWQHWLDDLVELQQLWQRQGFIAAFQAMLQRFAITHRLARAGNGERRMTNLLHLSELLQQQSLTEAGQLPLLRWFETQFDEPGENEDAELRLEDDAALVKIVTIHKSKGLQYPIVFVPFLWSCRQADRNGPLYFHDSDFNACVDLGSTQREANWLSAEKERLAEDLRLLYVAVTRARSRVYLAWGLAGSASYSGYAQQTALAWLLHSRQTPADLESAAPDGFGNDLDFDADLQRLVERGNGSIECCPLPAPVLASTRPVDNNAESAPRLARFARTQPNQWRVNSFTALTRNVHQPPTHGTRASATDPILDFPAGSHVGLLLHALLEHLDFQADVASQCPALFDRFLAQFGIADAHRPTLQHWLEQILQTTLHRPGADACAGCQSPAAQRACFRLRARPPRFRRPEPVHAGSACTTVTGAGRLRSRWSGHRHYRPGVRTRGALLPGRLQEQLPRCRTIGLQPRTPAAGHAWNGATTCSRCCTRWRCTVTCRNGSQTTTTSSTSAVATTCSCAPCAASTGHATAYTSNARRPPKSTPSTHCFTTPRQHCSPHEYAAATIGARWRDQLAELLFRPSLSASVMTARWMRCRYSPRRW